jgi:hypothetical protein
LEKPKFEFQQLELPKHLSSSMPKTPNEKNDVDFRANISDKYTGNTSKAHKKYMLLGYFFLFTFLGIIAGYFLHQWQLTLGNSPKKPLNAQKTSIKAQNTVKYTEKQVIKKPTYFNYYDSIIFLNDVKGKKIVVSKGFDEYIKKNKIIVKSDGFYYNLFCPDLYKNYSVGDSIL